MKVENTDVVTSTCKILSLETEAISKNLVTRELRLLKRNSG